MIDVTLTRRFDAPPTRVFAFVTQPDMLALWWGHDGWSIEEAELDFTRPGPWFAKMRSDEGNPFHHGGEVLSTGDMTVTFSWQWLNANGRQSDVSTVTFSVTADGDGSLFTIHHTGLPDDDFGRSHEMGWNASLARLTAFASTQSS
ncbi:SRPBCC domain-containing protein [Primorskyibacter aestuariivivens]|uniref:SRPBCC family protein n=1 Tax=Primorskyibacter aestuariivivens TaxID=1888912 RepID=UPI0023018BDE|nr:SRPBCC domain-containing protein [Primorskyibacter aestuariivivens]MDA7429512.1 SRPBCC domain-containing protein [Primorskyibacter aestuariivivens]